MTLKIDANFEEKLICCFKNDKNLVNFDLSTQDSQTFYFDWFFLYKVYNVWPKKVQRSYISWHGRVMTNFKKNWLVVWKMTWKYGKFSPKHLKNFNIGTLIGSFHPKYKIYEFKTYRGVMCHYNEELYNIWRGMDLSLQNCHEKFDEFWPKHSKISKTCTLMGSLRRNYIMLELKKYRAVMFDGTEDWCKTWRKTDLRFSKWQE